MVCTKEGKETSRDRIIQYVKPNIRQIHQILVHNKMNCCISNRKLQNCTYITIPTHYQLITLHTLTHYPLITHTLTHIQLITMHTLTHFQLITHTLTHIQLITLHTLTHFQLITHTLTHFQLITMHPKNLLSVNNNAYTTIMFSSINQQEIVSFKAPLH